MKLICAMLVVSLALMSAFSNVLGQLDHASPQKHFRDRSVLLEREAHARLTKVTRSLHLPPEQYTHTGIHPQLVVPCEQIADLSFTPLPARAASLTLLRA